MSDRNREIVDGALAEAGNVEAVLRAVEATPARDAPVMAYDPDPPEEESTRPALLTVRASDIQPKAVEWLWPNRIPLGMVTLMAGHPGGGKSMLSIDIAARVSRGDGWPDGPSGGPAGDVLMVNIEDPLAEVVIPRLRAAQADMKRVHLVEGIGTSGTGKRRAFTFADVEVLRAWLSRLSNCRLVVIDPVGAYMGGATDAHRDNEVRALLTPLATLAAEMGVAVVLIAHTRKTTEGRADDSVMGSRAFTGLARVVWHIACDPDNPDLKMMLGGKCNIGPPAEGLAFRVVKHPDGPTLAWEAGTIPESADQVFSEWRRSERNRPGPDNEAERAAVAFIERELAGGPVAAGEMYRRAGVARIAQRTLQRAKKTAGVQSGSGPKAVWSLPDNPRHDIAGFD